MISQKLRNYDMARKVHLHESYAEPRDLSHLPDYENCVSAGQDNSVEHCMESDVEHGSSSSSSDMPSCCDVGASAGPPKTISKSLPSDAPPSVRCGCLPEGVNCESFHEPPDNIRGKNTEGHYLADFAQQVKYVLPSSEDLCDEIAEVQFFTFPLRMP